MPPEMHGAGGSSPRLRPSFGPRAGGRPAAAAERCLLNLTCRSPQPSCQANVSYGPTQSSQPGNVFCRDWSARERWGPGVIVCLDVGARLAANKRQQGQRPFRWHRERDRHEGAEAWKGRRSRAAQSPPPPLPHLPRRRGPRLQAGPRTPVGVNSAGRGRSPSGRWGGRIDPACAGGLAGLAGR
jgi:hypothetical protein